MTAFMLVDCSLHHCDICISISISELTLDADCALDPTDHDFLSFTRIQSRSFLATYTFKSRLLNFKRRSRIAPSKSFNMMPIFDISYIMQQPSQPTMREVPLSATAEAPSARSRDGQPISARDHYYQLQGDPPRKPWYYKKKMLPFTILMAVISAFISCIIVVMKLTRKSALMLKAHPKETITQSVTAMATSPLTLPSMLNATNRTSSLTKSVSGPSSITTTATKAPLSSSMPSILSSSNLASVFVDGENSHDSLEILVWQDETGSLSYLNGESNFQGQKRIQDSLKDAPKAKKGTSLSSWAAVVDDTSTAHLFYLEENNTISHIFMQPKGSWTRGGLSAGSKKGPAAHEKSMLSAAFHRGEHDTNVVVLSYQDPGSKLQLAISEDPKNDNNWYSVDFDSFTGRHDVGDWGGVGHAIAGDWQNKRHDSDGSFSGLLMAIEESEEITPWECSVEFHVSLKKKVECHFLDKTFLGKYLCDYDGRARQSHAVNAN